MNNHLQLVVFMLNCYLQESVFRPFKWVTELATLSDGETVALDWVGEIPNEDLLADTPVLMLHHGAGGRSTDLPGQAYVRDALQRGWLVCALNRRGHKPGVSFKKDRWNFFGCPEDLRCVIRNLVRKKRPKARVLMIGISAGSGLVARFMGEQGRRSGNEEAFTSSFCDAAVGVSPGFDIERCMSKFGPPYSWAMLHFQKEFLRKHNLVFGHKGSYDEAINAQDLQSWLNSMWSIANDEYSSSQDYYDAHNPMRVTDFIREPCLFINAEDDPLCVKENIFESQENGLMKNDMNGAIALTKTGSHCSFYELGSLPFQSSNWAERVCFEFFDAFLASNEHKT